MAAHIKYMHDLREIYQQLYAKFNVSSSYSSRDQHVHTDMYAGKNVFKALSIILIKCFNLNRKRRKLSLKKLKFH